MASSAEDARATLNLCGLVGSILAVLGGAVLAVGGAGGEGYGVGSLLGLAAFAVGGLLVLVAVIGWAVSLGVRAAAHDGEDAGAR
ncbi:hypothetical protein QWY28_10010 [Nocardioides sp. SOB77]|uniref:Major facilitator superfamily (MFS) profile domain-containing protein n=1 Tax=Nocardioides oceani TaxID=3058369 RepID=A0ABT8FFC6_9ACTN|nr:hypothetical protein [Nocardioides oceani]MDN4173276.1 hypothetical protein [Nocardioides oceani]